MVGWVAEYLPQVSRMLLNLNSTPLEQYTIHIHFSILATAFNAKQKIN